MIFLLDKNSKIVLYGAGSMAVSWMKKAGSIGFTVRLFIDKRAEDIKNIENIPVVTFDSYQNLASEDDTVIIMLQNVMWHREIVIQLQKLGIRKIIFFPLQSSGLSTDTVFCLRRKYNECIKFQFNSFLKIPILEKDDKYGMDEEIIWENQNETIVWVPVELCYSISGNREGTIWKSDYTQEAIELRIKYIYNKSIFALRPYWELFSYLNGKKDDCSIYLKIFGKEGHASSQGYDNKTLLKDRNKLINIFKNEVCKGNKFFEQSPADCSVGERGKIVVNDGIHRSVFLIDSGYWWIPACLSNKDYNYLFNIEAVQKLKDYIESNNMDELEYPIEAFGFYNYPIKYQYVKIIWKELIREVINREWDLKVILDLSLTDAYFSRMFYREGAKEIYCLLNDKSEIPKLANNIFRIRNIDFIYNTDLLFEIMSKCEIIIIHIKQLINLFSRDDFTWKTCLKCIIVYDVLIEEATSIFERISNNRKINLIKKYVMDGMMKGMYIIE